jgi:hypothetical protein
MSREGTDYVDVGVDHVVWDEDFSEKTFAQV